MLFDLKVVLEIVDGLLQSSTLCTPPTGSQIVVSSQIDADQLGLCHPVDGSVLINATGSISLDGVRNITGSLSATGGITAIASNSLLSVGGVLQLEGLTGLETLEFSSLISVGGLSLSLPNLQTLSLGAGLQDLSGIRVDEQVRRSCLINGTKLLQLEGLNFPLVDKLIIENNANLESITLGLESLGAITSIARNGKDTSLSFPFLRIITGNNTSFQDLQAINLPNLMTVNGSLAVENNKINALDLGGLVSVSGQLAFQGNGLLQNISAPELRKVGELVIIDNPSLLVIDGFNSLEDASTGITVIGNQTSVAFPDLNSVENFYLFSSNDEIDCRSFENLRCGGIINDQFQCQGNTAPIEQSPSSCDEPYKESGLTSRKKVLVTFGVLVGVLLLVASVFLYWFRGSICSLLRRLRPGDNSMKINEKVSRHRRIESNNFDTWFESGLDADTRYMYVSRNRVMDRGRPLSVLRMEIAPVSGLQSMPTVSQEAAFSVKSSIPHT